MSTQHNDTNPGGLFEEQQVLSENQHEQGDIRQELGLNESIGFFWTTIKEATSEEYGDFIICQGLKVNLSAGSVDELLETATPYSFIPNVLLNNKIEDGSFATNELYRIEKTWDKGQKFKDGTKAKGYGFTLYHQNVNPEIKQQLQDVYKNRINPLKVTEAAAADDTQGNPANVPST